MEVKGLDMMNAIREYLIPIMNQYEIWEPLAEFLGIDPEDGPATLFDDLTGFQWTIDEKNHTLQVIATYREDQIIRFNLELYPYFKNDDRHFLKKFTAAMGMLEDAKNGSLDGMEMFEVNATPYIEENRVEYMIVSAMVNGVDLYDTANHILRKDADVPYVGTIEKMSTKEKCHKLANDHSEKKLEITADLFTVPFMYELLKRTAEMLHLNSPIYDGPIQFAVPYDTSYERTILYGKIPDTLHYIISGTFEMNDGKQTSTRVSAEWNVRVLDRMIKLIPTTIHMDDALTNDITSVIIKESESVGELSVSMHSKSAEYGSRSKMFLIPANYNIAYMDISNFYEVYNYLRSEDTPSTIDQIRRIARSYILGTNSLKSAAGLATTISLYHEGGFETLDYTPQDLDAFLDDVILGDWFDPTIKSKIQDLLFSVKMTDKGEPEYVIHEMNGAIMAEIILILEKVS